MDEFLNFAPPGKQNYQLILATVGTASSSGVTLTFDGLGSPTQKHFKRLAAGDSLSAGDRVIVAKMSGTYVVIGKLTLSYSGGGGSSVSPYNSNPAALGIAAPGSSNDYARGDHVHPKPDIPAASTSTPLEDGTASAGSSAAFARGDHVHPHDSSKADKAGALIPANSDLNDYYTTGQYHINSAQAGTIANCPVSGTFLLKVETCGTSLEVNRLTQRLYTVGHASEPVIYERMKNGTYFTPWKRIGVPPEGNTQYFYIDGSSTTVNGETVYAGDDSNTGLTASDPLRTLDRAFYLSNGNDLRISFRNKYANSGTMVYSTGKTYFSGMSIHFINAANTAVRINFTGSRNIQFYNCYTHVDGIEFSWASGYELYFDGGFANHSGKTLNGTMYPVKFITGNVNYNGMAAQCDNAEYVTLGIYESVGRFQYIKITDTTGSVDGITCYCSIVTFAGASGVTYPTISAVNTSSLISCTFGELYFYIALSAASGRKYGLTANQTVVHCTAARLSGLASIASSGNNIQNAAAVFQNASPAYFGEHGEYGPYYVKNDTLSRGNMSYVGCATGGPQGLYFAVPVDKSLENISTITVTTCTGAVRGPAGAVDSSANGTDWLTKTGYTVTAVKVSGAQHMFELRLTKNENIPGVDNNCVITGRLSLGLSFT